MRKYMKGQNYSMVEIIEDFDFITDYGPEFIIGETSLVGKVRNKPNSVWTFILVSTTMAMSFYELSYVYDEDEA